MILETLYVPRLSYLLTILFYMALFTISKTPFSSKKTSRDKLTAWTQTWQMIYYPSKCYVLRINRSRQQTTYNHTMSGHTLQSVDQHPYLGVIIPKTFNWKAQVSNAKTLGLIKRNLHPCPKGVKSRAYISLIRPTMKYASTFWDPCRQYQIQWLENVQRRAARFATRTYGSEQGCVTRAVSHLQWPSLMWM